MPIGESDISWQVLREIVRDWAGSEAELVECKRLVGGYIHTTLLLCLRDGLRAVLKISPHRVDRGYLDEAHQLQLLRQLGLPAPRVYRTQIGTLDRPDSYILMEHVDGCDLGEARRHCSVDQFDQLQVELAELVARLHDCRGEQYCRAIVSREETGFTEWSVFFREIYDIIWREAEKKTHLPVKISKKISKIHGQLPRLLNNADQPRLVHWDLWSNNLLAKADNDGHWRIAAVLDPNCKYADAEAEIAYLELFQTVTPAFMKTYQRTHKLSPEYHRTKKLVYQMYPLIDHVNLFGQEYVARLCDTVDKLSAAI